jgi:general secretion pathway protein B
MSYILDALKKSEQERGHGSVPGVQTVHSSSLNYRNDKKAYWPYVLIVAVVLNLLAILYFITEKDKSLTIDTEETQNKLVATITQEQLTTEITPTVVPDKVIQKPGVLSSINDSTNEQVINTQPPFENQQTETKPALTETTTTDNTKFNNSETPTKKTLTNNNSPAIKTGVIEFYDLPESTKQQLPAIIISAHVYSSNPLQRSIVINNNFLEEGEYVIDNLILHEITSDGAIFNYQGTLFHYGVVSSWQ